MELTEQKEHSVYSNRWGCAETCIINIAEITRWNKCSIRELDAIHGNWERTGNVTVCNYEQVGPGWTGIRNEDLSSKDRWSAKNDQMSHCLVQDWHKALEDVFWTLEIPISEYKPSRFEIIEYSGPGIPSHFCLYSQHKVINPDPAIDLWPLRPVNRFMI